jgi:hypothetical protein
MFQILIFTDPPPPAKIPKKAAKKKAVKGGCEKKLSSMLNDDDEDEGMAGYSELGMLVRRWKKNHLFCRAGYDGHPVIDVHTIKPPMKHWGAREIKAQHVFDLKDSFQKNGGVNETIKVVVVDTPLYDQWQEVKRSSSARPPTLKELAQSECGFRAFAGDHSTNACKELYARFRNNRDWIDLKPQVFLCPSGHETDRVLRLLGNTDNNAAGVQLSRAYKDTVLSTHEYIQALRGEADGDSKLFDAKYKELLTDLQASLDIPRQSVVAMCQLSLREGRIWDDIEKLMKGECKPALVPGSRSNNPYRSKPFVVPGSGHYFVSMSGIDDDTLHDFFVQVHEGDMTMTDFRNRTLQHKIEIRIKTHILDYVQASFGFTDVEAGQSPTWADMKSEYPCVWKQTFWKPWVQVLQGMKGTKSELPTDMDTTTDATIRQWQEEQVPNINI